MTILDQLLLLPLFQGMNTTDIETLAGQTKFGFLRQQKGKTIISEGDVCDGFDFLMNGTLLAVTYADDHGYSISEQIQAPALLQPECAFGLTQRYTRTFSTLTPCNMMKLDKSEILRLSEDYVVFRLNLLNILTTLSQRQQRSHWHRPPQDLQQRIVQFVANHCSRPVGHKTLNIKMTRLAEELNDSRLDVSRALNDLQQQGLLTLHRSRIEIPDLRQLLP